MVAKRNAVDIEEIRRWSEREGQIAKFNEFLAALRLPQ
jgi:hypothetical protein